MTRRCLPRILLILRRFRAFVLKAGYRNKTPLAAWIAPTTEASEQTSVKARVEHVKTNGRTEDLKAAELGSLAAMRVSSGLEVDLWLVPIEDRRQSGAIREGMRSGFTFGQYLMLVEYTGRMLREGKAAISSEVEEIFARLGSAAQTWGQRMKKLTGGRLLGRFLAASRDRLRQLASTLKVRHLAIVG